MDSQPTVAPLITRGAVATAFPAATDAAVEMLRAGGNAIDAAVAAAWALGVCEPSNSGLGGQTTLMLRRASGEMLVLDGHSVAPAEASPDRLSLAQQQAGHSATTVPTTPKVLEACRERFGRLSRSQTMAPAIALAVEGVRVTSLMRRQTIWCKNSLKESPTASALMLKEGDFYDEGDIFRQPALASTLIRMAEIGVDDFYQGQIARDIEADMRTHGGVLSATDLAHIRDPEVKSPLSAQWQGRSIFTVGPPGGGIQVLLGLRLMERLTAERDLHSPVQWYSLIGETTHAVFRVREELAIPLNELNVARIDELLCDKHIDQLAESVLLDRIPQTTYTSQNWATDDAEDPGETTHLCTADGEGNVVSLTQSIQSLFGARAGSLKLGFLYNNYLLTCPREPHPFQLAGGCRPRSNAAPTMLVGASSAAGTRDVLAIGAAGSRRITSAILQSLCGVQLRGLTLYEAVNAPRFHVKQSRNCWLELSPETEAVANELKQRFRDIEFRKRHSFAMGCVQALETSSGRAVAAVADPRREGTAAIVEPC